MDSAGRTCGVYDILVLLPMRLNISVSLAFVAYIKEPLSIYV